MIKTIIKNQKEKKENISGFEQLNFKWPIAERVRLCSDWLVSTPDWKKVIFTDEKSSIWIDQTIGALDGRTDKNSLEQGAVRRCINYGMGYAVTYRWNFRAKVTGKITSDE